MVCFFFSSFSLRSITRKYKNNCCALCSFPCVHSHVWIPMPLLQVFLIPYLVLGLTSWPSHSCTSYSHFRKLLSPWTIWPGHDPKLCLLGGMPLIPIFKTYINILSQYVCKSCDTFPMHPFGTFGWDSSGWHECLGFLFIWCICGLFFSCECQVYNFSFFMA